MCCGDPRLAQAGLSGVGAISHSGLSAPQEFSTYGVMEQGNMSDSPPPCPLRRAHNQHEHTP